MVSKSNASETRPARLRWFGLGVACWMGMINLGWGQFGGGFLPNPGKRVEESASQTSGTPLDIDRRLRQSINLAEDFLAEGKTPEALEIWQNVLTHAKNALTTHEDWSVTTFAKRKYTIYRPITSEIERRLAKLPAADLRLYRQTYDADAELLLKADPEHLAALEEVVDHYFMSSLGDEAAYYLAMMRFDEGDYVGSARLMQKILASYPESNISPKQLRYRLALTCVRMRDFANAKTYWAEYQDLAGGRVPEIVRRTFRQELARAEKTLEPVADRPASWKMQLGGPARNLDMPALPSDAVDEQLSENWVAPLETQIQQTVSSNQNTRTLVLAGGRIVQVARPLSGSNVRSTVQRKALAEEWRNNGWMPARQLYFDQGRMFVNGNARVLCVDSETGRTLWMGRRYQYEADPAIRYFAAVGGNFNQGPGRLPITIPEIRLFGDRVHPLLTVDDGTIYALEGQWLDWSIKPKDDVVQNTNIVMGMRRARKNWMAAYDARTGKLKWHREAGEAAKDEAESTAAPTGFLAAPVPFGDRLLVPVSMKGELWVYSLHKDTGKTDWKMFLWDEPLDGVSPWSAIGTAVEGADLYIATGMGLVFALDAATGKVHWATRYARQGFRPNANTRAINPATLAAAVKNGWMEDLVIPQGNQLVVLPSDYDHIVTLDRRTGNLLWDSPQVPIEGDPRSTYCLGVSGQGLFVGGKTVVRKYDIPSGRLLWECPVESASGQAALTPSAIYVPNMDSILKIDRETGRLLRETKFVTDTGEPVGNLFSDGRHLFGVGEQRIYALASLTDRMRSLAALIEDGDGQAQLRRMRLHLQQGNRLAAIEDLRAACRKIRQREGLLHSWVAMYGGLEELNLPSQDPETALAMLVESHLPAIAQADRPGDEVSASIHSALETQRGNLIYSALQVIAAEKRSSALKTVLKATVLCTTPKLENFAVRAVADLAGENDRPLLEAALKSGSVPARLAAAEALLQIRPDDAQTLANALLRDPADRVRIRGALVLANQGDRKVLPILGDLLESDDLNVRVQGASVLRALTKQNFHFTAYEKPEVRAAVVAKWKNWIQTEGQTAELAFPLRYGGKLRGRTLYTVYNNSTVYESDEKGAIVWQHSISGPWSCQGLPNGNRLISSFRTRSIYEFDRKGKEVWKQDNLPGTPFSAERLDNGNTLVSCSNNRIYEYNPQGEIAWETSVTGNPRSAKRLDNGNTLIAVYSRNEVVEVDRKGDVVWRAANVNTPITAQRLPNGHTLVAQYNSHLIVELDAAGKTVWQKPWSNPMYDVQRLENGNTLVADSIGWSEIDPDGKTINEVRQTNGVRGICRY